jgi:hypothetical protein
LDNNHGFAVLLDLPAVRLCGAAAQVDASVVRQIVRRTRPGVRREVIRRTDDGQPLIARHPHGHHVALDRLAEVNASVEPCGGELRASLLCRGDVEDDVRRATDERHQLRCEHGVLVTHSQSGALGWRTAIKNRNIKAVASYEPGGDYVFPDGEAPQLTFAGRPFTPPTVPLSDFMQLTRIPIVVYYGDNIPEQPSTNPGQEQWRVFRATARLWRDAVNRHGGDVTAAVRSIRLG